MLRTSLLSSSLLLLAVACRSTSPSGLEPDCVCGTPTGQTMGCYHDACVTGVGNPANPDCVCAGLEVRAGSWTSVSDGAGGGDSSRLMGQSQLLYLSSAGPIKGVLEADDGLSIRLRVPSGDVRTIPYDELAARSVYRLKKGRVPKDDGRGLLELGDFAVEAGYYAHARRHYHDAYKAAPELGKEVDAALARLREAASRAQLVRAREAIAKGDARKAEKELAALLREFPDEPAAREASMLLDRTQAGRRAEEAAGHRAEIAKALAPARKDYEKALELNRKGLLASSTSRSAGTFENAIQRAENAQRRLESLRKKGSDDVELLAAVDTLDRAVTEVYVDASINLASSYMVRSSFQKALGAVNRALAVDPDNQDVRAMRARIETASADRSWGWLVR